MVEFDNPFTSQRYYAYSYIEDGLEIGLGARLLGSAAALADRYRAAATEDERRRFAAALQDDIDLIEIARAVVSRLSSANGEEGE